MVNCFQTADCKCFLLLTADGFLIDVLGLCCSVLLDLNWSHFPYREIILKILIPTGSEFADINKVYPVSEKSK